MIRFLKSVLKGVLIGLIIWCIKGYIVKAESISDEYIFSHYNYSYNNSSWNYIPFNTFQSSSVNQRLYLRSDVTLYLKLLEDPQLAINGISPSLYGRYTICTEKNAFYGANNTYNSADVSFISTSIPCQFTGSSYMGYITFATYTIPNYTAYQEGYRLYQSTISALVGLQNISWQVLAHEWSFNMFPTYSSDSAIFDKLDNVIAYVNAVNNSVINGLNSLGSLINTNSTALGNIINSNANSLLNQLQQSTITINNQSATNTQNITNAQQDTTNAINDMNDTIKDDNVDNPQDYSSNVATNGVITQLITLPITLFQKLLNSTSANCSPFNLGSLYGTNLTMPCINLQNYLGSSLFNVIDILISGLFIYAISRKMVKVFNALSTMKEGDVVNG